ncbi:hypothetical protein WME76_31210 [Sorangium sp. So ce119]|uniref:5'-methylthioadenosine/S-adenosylhomocysteine nucleosidase family protein n=1 Tax=Sorangium sp. So ce119 TaxID=3133279 RepID=UPI003F608ACD
MLDVETSLPEGTEVRLARLEQPEGPRCDVLLFVTTETERKALVRVMERLKIQRREISGRFSEYLDLGSHSQYRVFAVETEMGALQAGGSATKGLLCPFETGARYIVAVGMAFGVDRREQNFGDVLVASHVLPYDFVLIDTDADGRLPRIRYDNAKPTPTNPALIGLLRRHIERSPPGFRVHFGAMLSGSAQIRCGAYRDHLVAKLNKKLTDLDREQQKKKGSSLSERVIGGEMEGVGLLATPPTEGSVSWLIVKGISDFADEEHKSDSNERRSFACENAIELVLAALASTPPAGAEQAEGQESHE